MPRTVAFERAQGLARFTMSGSVTEPEALRLEPEVLDARRDHQCWRVLFDMREAQLDMSIFEVDNLPQHAVRIGIDRSYRVALLYARDDRKYQHLENVATIHGLDLRSFTDEGRALAWLQQQA